MIKSINGSSNNLNENKKGNSNKKDKVSHISTIDALLDDYSRNKSTYTQLFSENDKESINHQFLEGLYIKYSKNLENYMKQNKKGMKLSGTRRYDNVAVDLFLKESKSYKAAIISELHNKYKSKLQLGSLDDIFLTPLPDKPRVLLSTQQQKDEFQAAERLAVVMRTVEYTSALKYLGNQYPSMKNDERQGMIYIMRRATLTIQNWWNSTGKIKMIKRRKERTVEKNKKNMIAIRNIHNKIMKRILRLKAIFFNKLKECNLTKGMTINRIRLTILGERRAIAKKPIKHLEYYTKANESYTVRKKNDFFGNASYDSKNKKVKYMSQQEKLIYLQQYIKSHLKLKTKKTLQHRHLSLLFKYKDITHTNMLLKSILQWIRIIRYETSNKFIFNNHSSINSSLLPHWYTYLPKVLDNLARKRFNLLFDSLKLIQQRKKGITNMTTILLNHQLSKGLNPIKRDITINLLRKIIIRRHKQNCLWKYYQLWNIKNLIVHIFMKKINKQTVLKAYKIFFKKLSKKNIIKDNNYMKVYGTHFEKKINSFIYGFKRLKNVIHKYCLRNIRHYSNINDSKKVSLFYMSSNVHLDGDNDDDNHNNNNRKRSRRNSTGHPRICPLESLNKHQKKDLLLRDLENLDDSRKFI